MQEKITLDLESSESRWDYNPDINLKPTMEIAWPTLIGEMCKPDVDYER